MCVFVCSVLSVSPELLGVAVLPVGANRWSLLHGLVALLVETSGLLARSGQTSKFTVVLRGRANPVDARISTDGLVGWVNHDDLVELERGVLSDPVGVEHAKVGALSSDTLLSNGLVRASSLDLLNATGVARFSMDGTLGDVSLATASAHANSVHHVPLLSLVAKLAGFVRSGGSLALVDDRQLAVLPCAHSQHESDQLRLLLSPELFEVLVGSHCFLMFLSSSSSCK